MDISEAREDNEVFSYVIFPFAPQQFVPVCDRLLQLLQRLSDQCDRSARGNKKGEAMQKAVEVEVNLKMTDAQKSSMVFYIC